MSRIGKVPVQIPSGVDVTIDGNSVRVKGPKGELQRDLHPVVHIAKDDSILTVTVSNPEQKFDRALWGLSRKLVANMIEGVEKGFDKKLELVGVGYKAAVSGKSVTLNLGYSHPTELVIPDGITVDVEKNTNVTISGIDKEVVGNFAAKIRALRKPEPYKGKGVKYSDEVVRRKPGKAAKAVGDSG